MESATLTCAASDEKCILINNALIPFLLVATIGALHVSDAAGDMLLSLIVGAAHVGVVWLLFRYFTRWKAKRKIITA